MSGYVYKIVGAGRQGTAAAYDLAVRGDAVQIVMADVNEETARAGARRVNELAGREVAVPHVLRLEDETEESLARFLAGADAAISAVPYFFNLKLSRAAVEAGVSLCDFGGNTDVVLEQLNLDEQARAAGISLIPDCGQVPGLGNCLAVYAMEQLDEPRDVMYWDGGLPQNPRPPLNYAMTFHAAGLTNEYRGEAVFLRDGHVVHVPALTEHEQLTIPGVGEFEAFVTSGGTSTCPWTFQGKLRTFQNKTLRYPGHFERIKFLEEMGLLDDEPVAVEGAPVSPREVLHGLLERGFRAKPGEPDIVIIYLQAKGLKGGKPAKVELTLVHHFDEQTGFTAMEQTTGWHGSVVAAMMARKQTPVGAKPVEVALSAEAVVEAMAERGIRCTMTVTADTEATSA